MIRRKLVRNLAALALSFVVCGGLVRLDAWSPRGHKVVAYVAFQHLTPAAKTKVFRLLKLNPQYQSWISGLPPGATTERLNRRAFVQAAHWPDFIKSVAMYHDDGTD